MTSEDRPQGNAVSITATENLEHDLAQHLFTNTDLLIVALNQHGQVRFASPALCTLLGYTADELLDRDWFEDCLSENQRHHARAEFFQFMGGTAAPAEQECKLLDASGSSVNVRWKSSLRFDPQGEICGMISSAELSSDLKLTEKARRHEVLSHLTAGIAHDFNNYLASILGYADLTLDSLKKMDEPELTRYISEVIAEGEKARDLVHQMTAYVRHDNNHAIPLNPLPLIKELAKVEQASVPEGMELTLNYQTDLPKLLIDPTRLYYAVLSLYRAAREAQENKLGNINLGVRESSLAQSRCSYCHEDFSGNFVEISLSCATLTGDIDNSELENTANTVHALHGHILSDSNTVTGCYYRILLPPA